MGDVLLQKTYTADFLEGKVKNNNGELPQYYIRDNHPAILTREEFAQIQEELARRQSKRPAHAKSKTNKGRFTSKYALSERLVCGCCGSPYRRVTWNIHGRKEIVWRSINRIENGKAGCPNSPSIPEEELHQAILEAVRSLAEGHQGGNGAPPWKAAWCGLSIPRKIPTANWPSWRGNSTGCWPRQERMTP